MKTLITPLINGKNDTLSYIINVGIGNDDRIVVVIPKSTDGEGLDRVVHFNKLVKRIRDLNIKADIENEVINNNDFKELMMDLKEIFSGLDNKAVVNLTDDDPMITIGLTTFSQFYKDVVEDAYRYSELEDKFERVELPDATVDLTENEKKLLKAIIENPEHGITELYPKTEFSKATVSRLSRILEKKRVIVREKNGEDGRITPMKATLTGRILDV